MKMNFINMSPVLDNADRKLIRYIRKAGYYMEESDIYAEIIRLQDLSAVRIKQYENLKDYYLALARCELNAARSLISWLEEMDLIDLEDWRTMNHTLVWMGSSIPEDRA